MSETHDEDRENKLKIAKMAYRAIIDCMEEIKTCTDYEMDFCWDECIWVDDTLFHYHEMNKEEDE